MNNDAWYQQGINVSEYQRVERKVLVTNGDDAMGRMSSLHLCTIVIWFSHSVRPYGLGYNHHPQYIHRRTDIYHYYNY